MVLPSVILLTVFVVVNVISTEGTVSPARNKSEHWDPMTFNDTDFIIENKVYKIKNSVKENPATNITGHKPTQNGSKNHHTHTHREDDDHYTVVWFILYLLLGFGIFKLCHKCLYLSCFDRFFDYLEASYHANHNNIVLNSGRRRRDQVLVRYSRSEHVIVDNLYPGNTHQHTQSHPTNVESGPQMGQPEARMQDTENRQVNTAGYAKLLDEVD